MPNNRPHNHQPDEHLKISVTEGFVGRLKEFQELETARASYSILVINGISGSGKTQLMAQYVKRYLPEYISLWIKLNETTSWNEVLKQIRKFILCTSDRESKEADSDYDNDQETNADPEPFQSDYNDVIEYLNSGKFVLCFDDFHKPDKAFSDQFEPFARRFSESIKTSYILITSQIRPVFIRYTSRTFLQGHGKGLSGLSLDETNNLMKTFQTRIIPFYYIEDFHKLTGGMPELIHHISELIHRKLVNILDLRKAFTICKTSKDTIRSLGHFIFQTLKDEELDALKSMSVLIEPITKPIFRFFGYDKRPDILNALDNKFLILGFRNHTDEIVYFEIQDMVRRLCLLNMSDEELRQAHLNAAKCYEENKYPNGKHHNLNALFYHYAQISYYQKILDLFFSAEINIDDLTAHLFTQYIPELLQQQDIKLSDDDRLKLVRYFTSACLQRFEYKQVVEFIRSLQTSLPCDVEFLRNAGFCLYQTDNYEDALINYQKAIELLPTEWSLLKEMGDVYKKLGQTDNSRKCYEKAFHNFLKQSEFMFNGMIFEAMEHYEDALAEYLKAIDFHYDCSILDHYIYCLKKINDYELNLTCFERLKERCLKQTFSVSDLIHFVAELELLLDDLTDFVFEALYIKPKNALDLHGLAMICNRFDRIDLTNHYIRLAVEIEQENRRDCELGMVYYMIKNFEEAKRYYAFHLTKVKETPFSVYDEFEYSCFVTNGIINLFSTYHNMLSKDYDTPEQKNTNEFLPYERLVKASLKIHDIRRAIHYCKQWENDKGVSHQLCFHTAIVYRHMKQTTTALEHVRKALSLGFRESYSNFLINLYLKTFQYDEALEWIYGEYSNNHGTIEVQLQIAKFYQSLKQYDHALTIYQCLHQNNPTNKKYENLLKQSQFYLGLERKTYIKPALDQYCIPATAEAYHLFGLYCLDRGELEYGEKSIKKALDQFHKQLKSKPHLLLSKASEMIDCYISLKSYNSAFALAEDAIKVFPFDPYIRLNLSLCLCYIDHKNDAAVQARKAFEKEFIDYEPLLTESRWEPLRQLSGFPELLEQYIKREKGLAAELFAPANADYK